LAVTDFFFYRTQKLVLPEIIVSNTFQAGQIMVFTIAMVPLLYMQQVIERRYGLVIEMRYLLKAVIMVFLFYTRYQLYGAKGKPLLMTKIILQLLLVYVIYNFFITRLMIELLQ